jgi:hypothetical protein
LLLACQRTHTVGNPYLCDSCDMTFSQNSHLTQHRRTYTDEKPYPCDVCYQKFINNSALNIHRWTHTGEKPYHCDVSDMTFSVRQNIIKTPADAYWPKAVPLWHVMAVSCRSLVMTVWRLTIHSAGMSVNCTTLSARLVWHKWSLRSDIIIWSIWLY